jgi:isoquinoline 1-oxidoreductase beta subunit
VSDGGQDRLRVDRVVAAVDFGRVINPQGARGQGEGAVLDGLGAALAGEITVRAGVVQQSNFHDYRLLRIDQAPAVEVHFIASENGRAGWANRRCRRWRRRSATQFLPPAGRASAPLSAAFSV